MSKTAFILAAGLGSRMMPLTKKIPKPLLKIDNKPLIEYTLKLLEFHGFTKIGLNIFYQAEKLENYLKKTKVKIVNEKKLSGTAGGVLAIAKKIEPDSPFLVISSDMLVNFDLSRIYKFHLRHKAVATVCCYFRPRSKLIVKKSGLVLFDKKNRQIKEIIERPEKIVSQWVNSGVYIFNTEVLEILQEFKQREIDIPKDLLPKLLRLKRRVFAYPVNSKKFYQLGIDTPERIKLAESDITTKRFVPVIPVDNNK